jgi:hypothetical protein
MRTSLPNVGKTLEKRAIRPSADGTRLIAAGMGLPRDIGELFAHAFVL